MWTAYINKDVARTSTCNASRCRLTSAQIRSLPVGQEEQSCTRRRHAHRRNIKRHNLLEYMSPHDSSNPTSTPSWRETSSTARFTSGSRETSPVPQSGWHAHLGSTGTSRPPVYSKGSHSTSFSPNRVGLATSVAHCQIPQRNNALQVPHLTLTTSRSLTTSHAVGASIHQHIL